MRRGFLEELEESVEGITRERVDLVDDDDAPLELWGEHDAFSQVSHVRDLSVGWTVDLEDVRVPLRQCLEAWCAFEAGSGVLEVLAVE